MCLSERAVRLWLVLGPEVVLTYADEISQAIDLDSFQYANYSCLVQQHKHVEEICKKQLNRYAATLIIFEGSSDKTKLAYLCE